MCADAAREFAYLAGHKKEATYGFLLLVNLPLSLRGHGEIAELRLAKERQRIFSSVSFSTVLQCQIPDCYTDGLISAGCGMTVPHKS